MPNTSSLAPVVLFTYNRPWHTQQTVKALQKNGLADCSDLFIYSDGPKNDTDKENIQAVRNYLKTISGFKSIKIIKQKRNKGLADSVIHGVTEIVNKYGKIIVLEDDLLTSTDFLRFMNKSLDYYSEDKRVMQISGHMFNLTIEAEADVFFLPFTNSIGWATWEHAWNSLDPDMFDYELLKNNIALKRKFNLEGSYNYFELLEAQIKGKIDSWAIRWYLSVFAAQGLTLYPKYSLIKHIGFDSSGTHCDDSSTGVYATSTHNIDVAHINFPEISLNREIYTQVVQLFKLQKSLKFKVKNFFHKFRY